MSEKQTIKFGDICREVKLTTKDPIADGYERYIGLEHLDSGSLKIKRWGMIAEDNPSFTRVFKKGQILFGKRRPYLRKAAIAEFDGICSGDIIVIETKSEFVHKEFFTFIFLLESLWQKAISTSSGSLSPRTKFKSLEDLELNLPSNARQRTFVAVLEKALESQGLTDEFKSSANILKKCLIEKFRRGEFSKCETFKESPIGNIPSTWEVKRLGELFENKDNLRIPVKSADRAKMQGEIPYYGASGIIDYVDKALFNEDLLLLSEDGANLVDRNTPIAFKVKGPCFVNNHAHVYGNKGFYEIDLAVELIECMDVSNYITGTAQPKINKAKADSIYLPVPPENERKSMLNQLASINNVLNAEKEFLSQQHGLLKSLISEELI